MYWCTEKYIYHYKLWSDYMYVHDYMYEWMNNHAYDYAQPAWVYKTTEMNTSQNQNTAHTLSNVL